MQVVHLPIVIIATIGLGDETNTSETTVRFKI